MDAIEIKIDKTTLPEFGREVEFKPLKTEEWEQGIFEAPDGLFWKNTRKWWSPWEVIEWRYLEAPSGSPEGGEKEIVNCK